MSNLNSFEHSLLDELKGTVTSKSHRSRGRNRGRIIVASVAALTVTVGGAGAMAALVAPQPAYAVTESESGDVVITLRSLTDASGLERELAAHGIDASVAYDANVRIEVEDVSPTEMPHTDAEKEAMARNEANSRACGIPQVDMPTVEVLGDSAIITIPEDALPQRNHLSIDTFGDTSFAGLGVYWTDENGIECSYATVTAYEHWWKLGT